MLYHIRHSNKKKPVAGYLKGVYDTNTQEICFIGFAGELLRVTPNSFLIYHYKHTRADIKTHTGNAWRQIEYYNEIRQDWLLLQDIRYNKN